MEDEPGWVQRLRDGTFPPIRWLLVPMSAMTVVGAVLLWAEASHLPWAVDLWEHTRRVGIVVLVPPAMVIAGPAVSIAAWLVGRRDRRVVSRIRAAGGQVDVYLPVGQPTIREPDELPDPAPTRTALGRPGTAGSGPLRVLVRVLRSSRSRHGDGHDRISG